MKLEPKSPTRGAAIHYPNIDAGRYTVGPVRAFARSAVLVALALLPSPAIADVYAGIKVGTMAVDLPSTRNPRNLAFGLGYEIDNNLADLSIVGEVNRSVIDGKSRHEGDLEFESDAVFLVLKTPRSMFVSLRGGYVRDRIITDAARRSDEGLLLGVGIGGVAGRTRFMFEYTSIAQDGDFLSFGFEF